MLFPVLAIGGVAWLAVRAGLMWTRKASLRRHWDAQLAREPAPNAIRLVVLGDSLSQGVGASSWQCAWVTLAASYISQQTGRPVHVANYSKAGAITDDVVAHQLPRLDLEKADIVLLEIGVNDGYKPRGTRRQFAANLEKILSVLPADRTVVADLPFPKLRKGYQEIADKVLQKPGLIRVYPSRVFVDFLPMLLTTAGDFWHPNDKGYKLWFEIFRPGIDEVLKRHHLLKSNSK